MLLRSLSHFPTMIMQLDTTIIDKLINEINRMQNSNALENSSSSEENNYSDLQEEALQKTFITASRKHRLGTRTHGRLPGNTDWVPGDMVVLRETQTGDKDT